MASAAVIVWLGGSGDWTTASNWSGAVAPVNSGVASFGAQIGAGNAFVNSNIAIESLFFSSGSINGGAILTLAGPAISNWSGGTFSGTGSLRVAVGATLEISGTATKVLNRADGYGSGGRTLENLGTITWTGSGSLLGGDGAQVLNQAGAVFDLQSDATFGYANGGNGPGFINAGTFRKSAGTGTSTVSQTAFTTSGLVSVQTGTLSFASGVTSSAGTFRAASGASLLFSGGQSFNPGTSFAGAGTIRIDGGTTTVSGNLTSENLNFAAGTLQGSGSVSGTLLWTGGVWSGTGTLTVDSGANLGISGAADKILNRADGYGSGGRILENFGTTTWTGTGQLLGGDGAQIVNRASGTILIQNDSTLGYAGGGAGPTVTNQGTMRKTTATGVTAISGGAFVNSGLVDAQAGTLAFSSGVTGNAGSFSASSNATITFSGGQTFNDGTSFSSPAGNIRIISGATTISGTLTSAGLEFAGGDLYGSATIGGTMAWTAGTWRAADVVTFSAGSTLSLRGTADKLLVRADGYGSGGRILRTGGTLVWSDSGRIVGNDGAGIDVITGGLLEIRNDSSFVYGGGGNIPLLTNAGTVRKVASAGTTVFESVALINTGRLELLGGSLNLTNSGGLANQGVVDVQAGTLTSSAGGMTSSGGAFNVSSGAQIRYTGGTNTIVNSTFAGAGFVEVAGGTLLVSGATISGNVRLSSGAIGGGGTLTVNSGGSFQWQGGALFDTGTLAIASGGSLQISGSASKSFYRGDGYGSGGRVITNAGTTVWTGTGHLLGSDGAAFSNLAGGLFDAQGDATFAYGNGGSGPTFSNAGTVRKSAGAGATVLALPVYNSGVAESQSGTLRLSGGGSGNGQFQANGGVIDFAAGYTLTDGARLTGTTLSKLTAGAMTVPDRATATVGGTAPGRFSLEGGAIDGAGVFLVGASGSLSWSGGGLASTGILRIATGGELNLLGSINHDFYRGDGYGSGGRIIENFGTVNWSDGNIRGGDGAQFTNGAGGLVDLTGGGTFGYTGGGNGPSFVNAGTLRKSAGAPSTFSQTAVTTSGLVQVNAGSLIFASGVTSNAGSFFAGPGTSLTFSGGQTFNDRTSFSGTGLLQATAGPTTVGGAINASHFILAGGSLYGTATFNGTLEWTGGDMRGADTLGVAAGSTLLLTGAGDRAFFRGDGYGSGGRIIENFGSVYVENAGNLLGGDGAQVLNRSGGVFEFHNNGTFGYAGGGNGPSFLNEGTLRKTTGTGTSTIASTAVTQNGLVDVATGTLSFASSVVSNGGQFTVASGAALEFSGGQVFNTGTQISGTGLVRATAGGTTLSGNVSFANFELAGGSLFGTATLTSGLLRWTGGDLRGADTLTVGPAATLLITGAGDRYFLRGDGYGSGGRTIENRGTMVIQNAGNLLGNDGAQLINRAGGTVTLRNDATLAYGGGGNGPTFTNEGTLSKIAGTGTSTIAISFTNTGNITVTSGTLAFTSSFSSSNGGITLANGGAFSTTGTLNLGTAALTGTGTLTASEVTAGGLVSPGNSAGQLNLAGNLTLLATSTLMLELGGTAPGTTYDFLRVSGNAVLAGNLSLAFINGYQSTINPAATFTVVTAAALSGGFANVANGQRLVTADGFGSFQANYGPSSAFGGLTNSVILSNFVAVPEPSVWALMMAGSLLVAVQLRRRR